MEKTQGSKPRIVECNVNGVETRAFLDTGAGVSIVGQRLLEKLRQTKRLPTKLPGEQVRMKGINSASPVLGCLSSIRIHFGEPAKFVKLKVAVCEDWAGDLIIS